MLRRINQILDFTLTATNDDNIGSVHDFYFDAEEWTIRYLVADIGSWLFGRRVLIAPTALGAPNGVALTVPVNLTRQQIKESPDIDLAQPLLRRQETDLFSYYRWMPYWGFSLTNPSPGPGGPLDPSGPDLPQEVVEGLQNAEESNLRSIRAVTNYTLEATNGTIGHVADFFVDDESWALRYLLIDTGNWLPGRRVLIAPGWVEQIQWDESRLHINVTKEQVKHSPEYDPDLTPDQAYEEQLHQHYQRNESWLTGPIARRALH